MNLVEKIRGFFVGRGTVNTTFVFTVKVDVLVFLWVVSQRVYYAVICDEIKWLKKQDIMTVISEHEIVEATTNADINNGNLAWYENNVGEIAGLCESPPHVNVRLGDGKTYVLPQLWSNSANSCKSYNTNK